jgi:hypothetical protein
MSAKKSKPRMYERIVKGVKPNGDLILMSAKEARAWKRRIRTKIVDQTGERQPTKPRTGSRKD